MGNVVDDLAGRCRLVEEDGDRYYIVSADWNRQTEVFDDVVSINEFRVVLSRDEEEYVVRYDSGGWVQECRATGDDRLYCADALCARHPTYDSFGRGSRVELPALTAEEYGEWSPPFRLRLRLAYRRLKGDVRHN